MALSKKALQLKREKKKKKQKIRASQSCTLTVGYNNWPIFECLVPVQIWTAGIGQIIVSRKSNQGEIAAGIYLVDTFCLGIKDCFARVTPLDEYNQLVENCERICGEMNIVDPSYACTLIHKAVDFAKQFGFKPHADFSKAKNILNNIPIDEELEFIFGRGGKPCYIQGPHETPSDVKRIMRTLGVNVDKEDFDCLIEAQNPHPLAELS